MAHEVMINGVAHRYSKARGCYVPLVEVRSRSGQCDGCPAGTSSLCVECGLCSVHCSSHGCGYSPHAWQVYEPGPEEGYDVAGRL